METSLDKLELVIHSELDSLEQHGLENDIEKINDTRNAILDGLKRLENEVPNIKVSFCFCYV